MAKNSFRAKLFTLLLLLISSCDFNNYTNAYRPKPEQQNSENSAIYALGRIVGRGLDKFDLSEEEIYVLHRGIYDEVLDKKTKVDYKLFEKKIEELLEYKRAMIVNKNVNLGAKLLEKLRDKKYQQLDANLLIKISKQGDVSTLDSDYEIISLSGKRENGEKFVMFKKNKVHIPSLPLGVQKAIKLIGKKGIGKAAFSHEYGFGYKGSGNIKGGEALLFDIEVF